MTTKLSGLLREVVEEGDLFTELADRVLAEAERLDAGGVVPLPNCYDTPEAIYDAGWLAACGGEEKG